MEIPKIQYLSFKGNNKKDNKSNKIIIEQIPPREYSSLKVLELSGGRAQVIKAPVNKPAASETTVKIPHVFKSTVSGKPCKCMLLQCDFDDYMTQELRHDTPEDTSNTGLRQRYYFPKEKRLFRGIKNKENRSLKFCSIQNTL